MLISAKEIINKSLELLKRDFSLWFFYIVVNFGTAFLWSQLVFNSKVLLFFATLGFSSTFVLCFNMVFVLLLTLLNIWIQLALVRTIHSRLFNQAGGTVKSQFAQSRHLLSHAIGISIVVALIVSLPLVIGTVGLSVTGFESLFLGNVKGLSSLLLFFGLLLLYGIFHSIYFSLKYAFSYYLVAIDEKTVGQSLHEGGKLVSGRMLAILWRLVAPVLLFLLMYVLSNYILVALATWLRHNWIISLVSGISLLVSALVAVLSVIATVILFEDVKTKSVAEPVVKKV